MTMIEEKLLKYAPKKLHQYITVLYNQCDGVYAVHVEVDNETYTGICDGVAEIRHAVNVMCKERRDYGM